MDIFTTVLTRVVPVPIKKANLKVKALAKKAAAHGVSDDIHGLEDHELYLKKTSNQQNEPQTQQEPEVILGVPVEGIIEPSPVPSDNTGQNVDTYDECDSAKPSAKESSKANEEDEPPHLDLFV